MATNPCLVAMCEAATLWPGAQIDALVSVGTGASKSKPFNAQGLVDWGKEMFNLAMSSHLDHKIAEALLTSDGKRRYWRFDVELDTVPAVSEVNVAVLRAFLAAGAAKMREYEGDLEALKVALG